MGTGDTGTINHYVSLPVLNASCCISSTVANMELSKCTAFPNLYSSKQVVGGPNTCEEYLVHGLTAPSEVLLISWAIILRSYTGDDVLVFRSDNQLVQVDSSDWTVKIHSGDALHSCQTLPSDTAVLFERVCSPKSPNLRDTEC